MEDWRPEAFMLINNIRNLQDFKMYQKSMHRSSDVHVILITWHGAKALNKFAEKQFVVMFCQCVYICKQI
jgi:DNA-binding LytR/AlgR family response regulator